MKPFRILMSITAAVLLPACAAVSVTPVETDVPTQVQPSHTPTTRPRPTATASPEKAGAEPGGTFGELVFGDEFNGPEIDTARWFVEDGHQDYWPDTPWRRNFKEENVYIEDGALVIRVAKEKVGFSSGALVTGVKGQPSPFEQAFGRFEARLRFPSQQGHWCAFWLWNESQGGIDGSGRDGTEIDILERAWLLDRAMHTLHWDGYAEAHRSAEQIVEGAGLNDGGWHVVRLDWYPDVYVFFVDGKETWRTAAGGVAQAPNYMILSDEIGNFGEGPDAWGVGPIENAVLPDYFYADYVRVYEYVPPQ
jgi:beta-glucanase (GH16 family)